MPSTALAKAKEKIAVIQARGRHHAQRIWQGTKGTAMTAGVGAGAGAVLDALSSIETLKGPYRKAGALILGGHLLKKKSHDAGTALIAIGGLKAYLDYTGKSLVGEQAATTAKGLEDGDGSAGDLDDDAGDMARRRYRRRQHRRQWGRFGADHGRDMRGGAMGIDDSEGLEDDEN